MAPTSSLPPTILNSIVNHLVLPHHLPGKQDELIVPVQVALIDALTSVVKNLRDDAYDAFYSELDSTRRSLQSSRLININGDINQTALLQELRTLTGKDFLLLYVTKQNAGLIVRKVVDENGDRVIFEASEASALSSDVLAATDALIRDFPGSSVSIPCETFSEPSFQEQLSRFLTQASTVTVTQFVARANKTSGFSAPVESRETANPGLISSLLMTILEANGQREHTPILRKRIRDSVSWNDGGETPWRRSGFWTLLKVAVERHMSDIMGRETGLAFYKFAICLVLVEFLNIGVARGLPPHTINELQAKLSRRMAKMEVVRAGEIGTESGIVYDELFSKYERDVLDASTAASNYIKSLWNSLKHETRRKILPLPHRASPEDMILSLSNSYDYVQKVLTNPLKSRHIFRPRQVAQKYQTKSEEILRKTRQGFASFSDNFYKLSQMEQDLKYKCELLEEDTFSTSSSDLQHFEAMCESMASDINKYLLTVGNAYDGNPEAKSKAILLVMRMFVLMDKMAVKIYPLLEEYDPIFTPGSLDVLRVPTLEGMRVLNQIQKYLGERKLKAAKNHLHIFTDPVRNCFADRAYDELPIGVQMEELLNEIQAVVQVKKKSKEEDWEKRSKEHEDLVRQIQTIPCRQITTDDNPPITYHDDNGCRKCYLERKARRIKIQIFEHPLPNNIPHQRAILFEMLIPKTFAMYRNTTWKILTTLALPTLKPGDAPRVRLKEYSELQAHNKSTGAFGTSIGLASMRKSNLGTHYREASFPCTFESICLRHGPNFTYFDAATLVWPGQSTRDLNPSFSSHVRVALPNNSPLSHLQGVLDKAIDSNGPTSAETVASQTKCPSGVNVQEFLAFQSLLGGKQRRLLTILIELGSSNMNFSTEAAFLLLEHLTLQAGPPHPEGMLRRISHTVFEDANFCNRLLEQLHLRMNAMQNNWREIYSALLILTMAFRILELTPSDEVAAAVLKLIVNLRKIFYNWVTSLRAEICNSNNVEASKKFDSYALWASLLLRRTFAIYVMDVGERSISAEDLRMFFESSASMQDSMPQDIITKTKQTLRNCLIQDVQLVYQLRNILRESLTSNGGVLVDTMNAMYPGAEDYDAKMRFMGDDGLEWWIEMLVKESASTEGNMWHFHLIEGFILVDGERLGRLAPEYLSTPIMKTLFGDQNLLVIPSTIPGLRHRVAFNKNGYSVHIGFRDGNLFVRAIRQKQVFEILPREIFRGEEGGVFDLPDNLIEKSVHWLDIRTGICEIRQEPNIWISRMSNWILDFNKREAYRRMSRLIDTRSNLTKQIAHIFSNFELLRHITIFQPEKRNLTVELRRLELSFTVNSRKLLESQELKSEIDTDQDCGTWYGLSSKIVLRDSLNHAHRSVIVPLGKLHWDKRKFHVDITLANEGNYGRYMINDVLGRIDCVVEPRLLYRKALIHAYTSFIVPDPLTGKTGMEECIHALKAANAQPWSPLNSGPYLTSLIDIAKLTPKREYYPEGLQYMEKVIWHENLPTTLQYDGYYDLVEQIRIKSEQLGVFALKKDPVNELVRGKPPGDEHLIRRGLRRWELYHRSYSRSEKKLDSVYETRDLRDPQGTSEKNVFAATRQILEWKSEVCPIDLATLLKDVPIIKGFDTLFDKPLMSDIISTDVCKELPSLISYCSSATEEEKYKLIFLLSLISYPRAVNMDIIKAIISFATMPELRLITRPGWEQYEDFAFNKVPKREDLINILNVFSVQFEAVDNLEGEAFKVSAKFKKKMDLAEREHNSNVDQWCDILAEHILRQWPCVAPTLGPFEGDVLVYYERALETLTPGWTKLYMNHELSEYLSLVQRLLNFHVSFSNEPLPDILESDEFYYIPKRQGAMEVVPVIDMRLFDKPASISLTLKMSQRAKPEPRLMMLKPPHPNQTDQGKLNWVDKSNPLPASARARSSLSQKAVISELEQITSGLTNNNSSLVRQRYGIDLMQSIGALKTHLINTRDSDKLVNLTSTENLGPPIQVARGETINFLNELLNLSAQDDPKFRWLSQSGLWPTISPVTVLELLRSTRDITKRVKQLLVSYGLSLTWLQRLLRMQLYQERNDDQSLSEEQKNIAHMNWKPMDYPDWLLLEIDGNFLIRPKQVDVAMATMFPRSGTNSVQLMNMGEGKTSCIMPMAAAVLASDPKTLVRVVVPKSLLLQTAQVLGARLGGLVGRELRHIPFSRKTSTTKHSLEAFHDIHKQMLKQSGILLALPEHNLSFMLSGLQRLLDRKKEEATWMVKIQSWLRKVCRDILDESDFTLAVKTQLIYPSGVQRVVDGHPERWRTTQALLSLVEDHLFSLQQAYPKSIEVLRRSKAGYPFIFLLRNDVEEELTRRLVAEISSGRSQIFPIENLSTKESNAIKIILTQAKVSRENLQIIKKKLAEKPIFINILWHLRGLLLHRLLLLSLKKRWNVQYGLHELRDPVAVPFHAKGVPSETAEFGHPDAAILLTCLSFYYGGLTVQQFRKILEFVLKSDDPSVRYDTWTHDSDLPDSLRDWSSINVDDEGQLSEIWKFLSMNTNVINAFLNSFVFPKHARQFHTKLQSSGWDIPLLSGETDNPARNGIIRGSLTTGFSGTNDNKTMLPLTIKQDDLPSLSHTNAEVLTYLLQDRNRQVVIAKSEGKRLSEIELLRRISKFEISVLIDAGAQILELSNKDLAMNWLMVAPSAPAAIFFNEENKPMVYFRKGHLVPLLATPYVDNTSGCLVYIDEAHCRGTDLKLPLGARGALTLGLGTSKDHVVQAAMRMRHLGTTQSIVTFAPPEVHQSILDVTRKHATARLDSHDVIRWLLEQTCLGIEQLQPLYVSQGLDFCHRWQAALDNNRFLEDPEELKAYLSILQTPEQQTLKQLYEPRLTPKPVATIDDPSPRIAKYLDELKYIRKRFRDNGNAVHGSVLQEVEQERHTEAEVENVREVQKPVHYHCLRFGGLHEDIARFARHGRLPTDSNAVEGFLEAIKRTGTGQKHLIASDVLPRRLFVSTEFRKTVKMDSIKPNDNFMRQVNYILLSSTSNIALVVSPEEAEYLLPIVRKEESSAHLITYASPITYRMLQHFNEMKYYAVPPLGADWQAPLWLKVELGIFAGRLYFPYEEFHEISKYLALKSTDVTNENTTDECRNNVNGNGVMAFFTQKPVKFMNDWLTIKRKGVDISHTPMGFICAGKPLNEEHPFFRRGKGSNGQLEEGKIEELGDSVSAPKQGGSEESKANGTHDDGYDSGSDSDI